jgi:putative DNA primase/helicase
MNLNEFMKGQAAPEPKQPAASPEAVLDFSDGTIPEGQRNSTLSQIAGKLVIRYGVTEEARKRFLEQAKLCNPPLSHKELTSIWQSAVKFGCKASLRDGYVSPEEFNNPTPRKPEDYSDLGQAYAFAKFCRDHVRYSPATDYIVYDGVCWQESMPRAQGALDAFTDDQLKEATKHIADTEEYMEKTGVNDLIATFGKNAVGHMSDEQLKAYNANLGAIAYKKFVIKRRDSRYLSATLKEAHPMVEIDHRELDKDGFLLNTPDYTVDLRKGVEGKLPHRAEDYITKCTAVAPGTKGAEIWEDAINIFFCGDEDLKAYVQKIVGLAAIGHVYVEALIIAYGEGRNGKSTFWNSISRVLGTYSGHLSADTLTVGCKRNVKPELAETENKRLIISSELEEGMRLSSSFVKQTSSTDEIFAEKKFKKPFSFTPTHTLVLYTNHLPKVGANDPGTWRRLIVVPFNARIEGSSDRKNYTDYLFDNAAEAILTWIIQGAEAVIKADFHIEQPECVKAATASYRENSDWLASFIEDCCEVGPSYTARSGDLYTQYRLYSQRTGEYTRSTTDFYAAVEFAGYSRRRTNSGRVVYGLRLKTEFDPETPPLSDGR